MSFENDEEAGGLKFNIYLPDTSRPDSDGQVEVLEYEEGEYRPNDIENCKAEVAAKMSYWNEKYGLSIYWLAHEEAQYRNWSASQYVALLTADEKISEWKAKVRVEALEDFLVYKDNIGKAERAVQLCKGAFESFKKVADLLATADRMDHQERNAAGSIAREEEGKPKPTNDDVRAAFAKRGKPRIKS